VSNLSEKAERLANMGQVGEALRLLDPAARGGDADALFTLASWLLAGQWLRRDLPQARTLFGHAGERGHTPGAAVYTAFLGNGTGGARDWSGALALLQHRAASDQGAASQLSCIEAMALTSDGAPLGLPEIDTLSVDPRVVVVPDFLSSAECAYLIQAATPLFEPSMVIDPRSNVLIRDPIRTSDLAGFPFALENPAIHAVNRRIAAATGTDPAQGEPLQILRYARGQEYKLHLDALPDGGNQRVMTFLIYLNDDLRGGETVFPDLGITIAPKRGMALFFANADTAGRADGRMRHAGLPIERGIKYLASRWIRAAPLQY
jgi:prolyl 4-hydroxylase